MQILLFEYEDKAGAEENKAILSLSEAAEENPLTSDSGVRKECVGFTLVQRLFEYLPGVQNT